MSKEVHTTVAERLRRGRRRYTSGRRRLVDQLVGLDRPATIDELLAAGVPQSQSSLYRNLATLEQCGVVRRLTSVDAAARFELAEELTEHHHHLVCHDCGRIDDVTLPGSVEDALGEAAGAASEQQDFAVDGHRVELVGICTDCR